MRRRPRRPQQPNARHGHRPRAARCRFGVTWIEREQAFNFAVHSEHAESVTLLLYSATDLVNPLIAFRFGFPRNKSGRIWHCRLPISEITAARYYANSVSGPTGPQLFSFAPQKVLLDPYAKCIFFPPGFDRELAAHEGSNAGKAPLGVMAAHRATFEWEGVRLQHHEFKFRRVRHRSG